jgi:hypothetical protein
MREGHEDVHRHNDGRAVNGSPGVVVCHAQTPNEEVRVRQALL